MLVLALVLIPALAMIRATAKVIAIAPAIGGGRGGGGGAAPGAARLVVVVVVFHGVHPGETPPAHIGQQLLKRFMSEARNPER